MIFKTLVAAGIFWGALYAAQHYLLTSLTSQVTANSGLNLLPPSPAFPTIEIDPQKLRQVINPPVTIDTKKYERLAIESMVRQMDQQNRAALSHVPQPMSIPGLRH
jgi:hypothetical protein